MVGTKSLGDLRREIDDIDDRLHELILARTAVVRQIGAIKGVAAGSPLRPGREAEVLRRRLTHDLGGLSGAVYARIWRELIAAYCRLQGSLSVAVCATEKSVGYWDLARDHFGSATRMALHHAPGLVVREVAEGRAIVGLLPMPVFEEPDPWWRALRSVPRTPQVIAKLPFYEGDGGRLENLQAVVISKVPYDPSSDDATWLTIAAREMLSWRTLNDHVKKAGLDGRIIATLEERQGADYLIETAGFVTSGDARLVDLTRRLPSGARIDVIGSYARPFRPAP
jgi:chorismate mutase